MILAETHSALLEIKIVAIFPFCFFLIFSKTVIIFLNENRARFLMGDMIKVPQKWRGTFIKSSFRWKLAYQKTLLISLRSVIKSQEES